MNVDVTSAAGTVTRTFQIPTCAAPAQAFSGSIAATDLSQNPRQYRDGVPTGCAGKTCTAPTVTGTFYYDELAYANAAAAPRCYTVNVNSPGTCNGNVFLAAYSPSFAGNGSCTNFLGDIGSNPSGPGSFQFTVPAGAPFELVVTATTASATCNSYAGSISGFVSLADGGRPTAAASGAATICPGQSTTLSGSGGATCSWTPATGLDDPTSCTPTASPTTTTTYDLTVATAGGCTSGNTSKVTVTVVPDVTDPSVTAPAAVTVDQPLCCGASGGATGTSSAALAAFLAGGSATDGCDPAPARLAPQVGGVDATNATCFEAGTTSVDFRYQDAAGNVGTASSSVTVRLFGDLDLGGSVDPADMVVLQSYFNFAATPGVPPFAAPVGLADLTHDTFVDPADMVILQSYFNFAVSCLAP
ncbi:MAG: hypothetical protein EDX89_01800 [Acidobacteria bacterium]|nr:MAG: hypothetical protein EDX89_01800 [Acidobacteriota bacterium]